MWWFWLILTIVFIVVELSTVSVICIWFATGAFFAMLVSFIPNSALWAQFLVFFLISALTLILARQFFLKKLKRDPIPTNFDLLIGKVAVIIEGSRAEIDGLTWAVEEVNGEELILGDKVEVLSIQGVKLIVKKI